MRKVHELLLDVDMYRIKEARTSFKIKIKVIDGIFHREVVFFIRAVYPAS